MTELKRRDFIKLAGAGTIGLSFPNIVGVNAQPSAGYSQWMSKLNDNLKLTALSMPGTHNSCTYRTSGFFKGFVQCQSWDLKTQLSNGIRFLDIRCRRFHNEFKIHHGNFYMKMDFKEVQQQCVDFLVANPSETIIMSMKEEYKPEPAKQKSFQDILLAYGDEVYQKTEKKFSEYWYSGNNIPQLKDIRGKIIFLKRFTPGDKIPGIQIPKHNWVDNGFSEFSLKDGTKVYIQDRYNPDSLGNKFGHVRQLLNQEVFNGDPNTLYLNFCSATKPPFKKIKDYSNYVNPALLTYIDEFVQFESNGITIMDFPTIDLIDKIIELNKNDKKYSIEAVLSGSGLLNNTIQIQPPSASTRWEVRDSGTSVGHLIQLWNSTGNQTKWKIVAVDNTKVKVLNINSKYYLGTIDSGIRNGTKCCLVVLCHQTFTFSL